jgi:hypothetical protein
MSKGGGTRQGMRLTRVLFFAFTLALLLGCRFVAQDDAQEYPVVKSSWSTRVACVARSVGFNRTPLTSSCGISSAHASRNRKVVSVAIVFYGLPRAIAITAPSIRRNVLAPLDAARIHYKTFYHHVVFNGVYTNTRNREVGISLNTTEWRLLHPDVEMSTEHDEFLEKNSKFINRVLSYGDPHDNDGLSTRNELEALHSLKRAVESAEADVQGSFDGMLILRPDLLYHDPVDAQSLFWAIAHDAVVTPAWQLGEGANDRFAFGAWEPMVYLGKRFDRVMHYCLQTSKPWHPEKFVEWTLAEYSSQEGSTPSAGLCHCNTEQRASRVRAHGRTKPENFCMPPKTFIHCS